MRLDPELTAAREAAVAAAEQSQASDYAAEYQPEGLRERELVQSLGMRQRFSASRRLQQ